MFYLINHGWIGKKIEVEGDWSLTFTLFTQTKITTYDVVNPGHDLW